MKPLLILALGAALGAGACGAPAPDTTGTSATSESLAPAGTAGQPAAAQGTAPAAAPGAARGAARAAAPGAAPATTRGAAPGVAPAAGQSAAPAGPAAIQPVAPAGPAYREVSIPSGTTLPLSLTSAVGSDTSAVEDAVTAELTRAIMIDGVEVLPARARLTGHVTQVDASGRVKGRALIAFRFTSVRAGGDQYDVRTEPLSHLAPATKGEDATKIGIGAGAGAVIGGILGGKEGAAKGAVVGGGAGTGVVLATKGQEVRLGPGADATTRLTAPLTVRVRVN